MSAIYMIFKVTEEEEKTNITNEAPKTVNPNVILAEFSEAT